MRKRFGILKPLALLTLLVLAFACEEPNLKTQPTSIVTPEYTITPLEDGKIKNEILSMVEGNEKSRGAENAFFSPPSGTPTLPSGYDYANAVQVVINGTNWITYVAYKTSGNTATYKEMVAIYYQGSTYKNHIKGTWEEQAADVHYYTHKYPEQNFYYGAKWKVMGSAGPGSATQEWSIRPPSACGQQVIDCTGSFFTQRGWLSVGLSVAAIAQPEVGLGVVGGCMLACALGL